MKIMQLEWQGKIAKTPIGVFKVEKFNTFEDFEEESGIARIWIPYFNGAPIDTGVLYENSNQAMDACQAELERMIGAVLLDESF